MEVQPTGQQSAPTSTGISTSKTTATQEDFLLLLTTQLQYQDPLNPMDNTEFTSQLATFNSLDQLISINGKLDAMTTGQSTASQLQATALIGKEVTAQGNSVSFREDGTVNLHYNLAANATKVVVNITDGNGNLVRTLDVGSQNAGQQTVTWDGKDNTGESLPPGAYAFEVNAFDVNGETVEATTTITGVVTGVTIIGSEVMLALGDLQVPLSAVTSVHEAP